MKKILITILVIALLIVMIPIRVVYKDGGSGGWHAVAWQYTKYHKMLGIDGAYRVGTEVKLFGALTVYDDTRVEYLTD